MVGAGLLLFTAAAPAAVGVDGGSVGTLTFTGASGRMVRAYCTIKTGNTYLRSSGAKRVVGFKPKVVCTQPMDSISLTGQMHAQLGGSARPVGVAATSANKGQPTLENRRIGVGCQGSVQTRWFGRATAKAVWRGMSRAAVVSSPVAVLPCGT